MNGGISITTSYYLLHIDMSVHVDTAIQHYIDSPITFDNLSCIVFILLCPFTLGLSTYYCTGLIVTYCFARTVCFMFNPKSGGY